MGSTARILNSALKDSERMRRDFVSESDDLEEENEKLQAPIDRLEKLQEREGQGGHGAYSVEERAVTKAE